MRRVSQSGGVPIVFTMRILYFFSSWSLEVNLSSGEGAFSAQQSNFQNAVGDLSFRTGTEQIVDTEYSAMLRAGGAHNAAAGVHTGRGHTGAAGVGAQH